MCEHSSFVEGRVLCSFSCKKPGTEWAGNMIVDNGLFPDPNINRANAPM